MQLSLPFQTETSSTNKHLAYPEKLVDLLSQDLDFHGQKNAHASHNFHSFPAKFPPQLPLKFIQGLTNPGDVVLDPMLGSGTTIVESFLSGRQAVGVDIDPLALLIIRVKVTPYNIEELLQVGTNILQQAKHTLKNKKDCLANSLSNRWDRKTQEFVNYWFAYETQLELLALLFAIEKTPNTDLQAFFKLVLSSVIITKSGGVSLALDLAHTRPHKAKIVRNSAGEIILEQEISNNSNRRIQFLTKTLRSPFEEFKKKLHNNIKQISQSELGEISPFLQYGNAQNLPLENSSVDLIVTSPPYASNAIDYMRAHKFSLVWLGYPIHNLGVKRNKYIGGEATANFKFEDLPPNPLKIISQITEADTKKGKVLHRYYSEMVRTLQEMYRVLKPGRSAIVVVGNSIMRGLSTETATCLADIGQSIGFDVPKIGIRSLDRNRRMMPAGSSINLSSQIQQRMHEEYVIGFLKPV